jgi:branched-chain amino acid transport system substrate-binding protein
VEREEDPATAVGYGWRRAALFGALLVLTLFWSSDLGATTVALPRIEDDMRLGFDLVEWLVTVNFLLFGVVMILAGRVADARPRTAFAIGLSTYVASQLLTAAAPNGLLLVIGRGGLGLSAAFITTVTIVAIGRLTPSHRLGLWLGIMTATIAVGDVCGGMIGGFVLETFGWRWMYGLTVPAAVVLAAVAWPGMRLLDPNPSKPRIPVVSTALLMVAITLVMLGFDRGPVWGWIPPAAAVLGAAAVLFVLFRKVDARSRTPVLEPGLLRSRVFMGAVVLRFLAYGPVIGMLVLVANFLQNVQSFDVFTVGLLLIPLFAAETVTAIIGGRLADAIGPRAPVALAFVLIAAGLAVCADIGAETAYASRLLPGFILFGVGIGLAVPAIEASAIRDAGPQRAGTAGAVLRTVGYVGMALGAALLSLWFALFTARLFPEELDRSGVSFGEAERDELHALIGTRGVDEELRQLDLATATGLDAAVRNTFVVGYRWTMWIAAAVALLGVPIALFALRSSRRASWRQRLTAGRHWQAIAAAAAVAALAGIGAGLLTGGSDRTTEAYGSSVPSRQLLIYSSLPLSGPDREIARDLEIAQRMALRDAGGRAGPFSVRMVTLDDATRDGWAERLVRRNARRAAQDARTIAYLGNLNSGATAAAMPILNRAGILHVSPTSTATGLTRTDENEPGTPEIHRPTGHRTFARVIQNDRVQAVALAMVLRQRGVRRVHVVHDGSVYGRGLANETARVARRKGIEVVANDLLEPGPTAVRAAATAVASGEGQALLYCGTSEAGAPQLFDAVHALDPELPLVGPDGLATPAFTRAVGEEAAQRVTITSPVVKRDMYPPAGQRFLERFRALTGREPTLDAMYGYEAMSAVLDSIAAAGERGNSRPAVVDAFFSIRDRKSVLGTYSIDEHGDTTLPTYGGYRIAGGELVYDS